MQPFPPAPTAANVNALAGWMMNANPSSSIQSPALAASSMPGPPNQGILIYWCELWFPTREKSTIIIRKALRNCRYSTKFIK